MNERRFRQVHLDFRGKLDLGGTAALDGETGQFGLESIPVAYEGQSPTVSSYLRLDEALAGESELAGMDDLRAGRRCSDG